MAPTESAFMTWFRTEFMTPRRLLFNLLWYGSHLAVFGYGWYSQQTNQRLAALNGLKFSVWTSRGAGLVLAYDGFMILVPMLRNVIRVVRPRMMWLFPADENIWFHRQVAYSLAFWAMVHTTAHYVNFINVERTQVRPETALQIHYAQPGGITGHALLLIMVLMYSTAHKKVRAQCFEAFWYTHHLAFFFMIGLYTHATGCFVRDSADPDLIGQFPFYSTGHCLGYLSWRFTIWPGILYFGERIYREIRARRETQLSKVLVHPSGAMELRINKPSFKYTAGQWLFIQVPEVSKFQWHPDVFNSEVAVLIGAGIGVTPFASILKHIWYRQKRGKLGALRRVEFIWVCRDAPSFGWFQTLLQEVEEAQTDPNFLRINIYLTQKIGEDMLWNIAVNDAGAEFDPLTLLRTRTMFGRPDWRSIYTNLRTAIEGGAYLPGREASLKTNVGTYFCGPGGLAKAIREQAYAASSSTVNFKFYKEHF
ncbi:hypothetical protein FRC01_004643 [Tulasnella sp. 417]|nr:hypothetical protein FRC01_004643 [Tulasnella sp. 417]